MRKGFNPNKDKTLQAQTASHRVIVPIYIPNSEGYFTETFDVLKVCVTSLLATINDDTKFEYIYYNLKYYVDYSKVTTGQIPKLNQQNLKEKIKIPLPSLEVQQQIVDELSQIETSIETIESRIAQLKREKDQYKKYGRKAEIRELLKDSEEKMLGEVCDNIQGGQAIKKENRTGGEIPYYGANGHIENSFMNKLIFLYIFSADGV